MITSTKYQKAPKEEGHPKRKCYSQQMQGDEVLEEVDPDAGDVVGVEQEQLEGRQATEDVLREILDLVAIENPETTGRRRKCWIKR